MGATVARGTGPAGAAGRGLAKSQGLAGDEHVFLQQRINRAQHRSRRKTRSSPYCVGDCAAYDQLGTTQLSDNLRARFWLRDGVFVVTSGDVGPCCHSISIKVDDTGCATMSAADGGVHDGEP